MAGKFVPGAVPGRSGGVSASSAEQLAGSLTSSMSLAIILGFVSSLTSMIGGKPKGGDPRSHAAGQPPAPPAPPDSSVLMMYGCPLIFTGIMASAPPPSQKSVVIIRASGLGRRN